MFRKLFLGGLVVAAGAVVWNEYRLFSQRSQSTSSGFITGHRPVFSTPEEELAMQQLYDRLAIGGEEQSEPTVIDLSWLQRQTSEPPVADTEEPGQLLNPYKPLPTRGVAGGVAYSISYGRIVPADFQKHSADGDDGTQKSLEKFDARWDASQGKVAQVFKKLACFVWGLPPHDGAEQSEPKGLVPEPLPVMPRPLDESVHHHAEQACPYLSGASGSHYRHYDVPAVRLHGEEHQSAPPAPKPAENRKTPKLDTMDLRPGDLPAGWPWRQF